MIKDIYDKLKEIAITVFIMLFVILIIIGITSPIWLPFISTKHFRIVMEAKDNIECEIKCQSISWTSKLCDQIESHSNSIWENGNNTERGCECVYINCLFNVTGDKIWAK